MIVTFEDVSKWYGDVLGASSITWQFEGGIVGLLGPNGAGKSTLMKMLVGLHAPSRGTVRVLGGDPFVDRHVRMRIGYAPEHERTYEELTALALVTHLAALAGLPYRQAKNAAIEALTAMEMQAHMHRPVRGFSKGMRQRTKLAGAIAHRPALLILDEPLTGVDPVARIDIINKIKAFAAQGTAVIVSSHVLYEIEALTQNIVVIYRGQVLADGDMYAIRQLIDKHPHRIRVECEAPHLLASELVRATHIAKVALERHAVTLETRDPDACYDALNAAIVAQALTVHAITSPDNNLAAVFTYLTEGRNS